MIALIAKIRQHPVMKNIVWLMFDNVLRMGVGLLVGVWVARYLGPVQFGLLNYAIAFTMIFTSVGTLGLDQIVIRDVIKRPELKDKILGTSFLLRLAGGFVALAASSTIYFLMHPDNRQMLVFISITSSGLIFSAFDVIDSFFQSRLQSKLTVIAKNSAFVVCAIAKVMLIRNNASLSAFVIATMVEVSLGAIGLNIVYRRSGNRISQWSWEASLARKLLKDSWPMIINSLMIMLYMRIDQIMIGEMTGSGEVGVYSVAVRLAEVWYFVPAAIVNSFYPTIVKAKEQDAGTYLNRMQLLYNIMTWTGIGFGTIMFFLSGPVIHLLYGHKYDAASAILVVLMWSGVFVSLGYARTRWLLTENLQRYGLYYFTAGAIVNILLNLVLIPHWKGVGSAYATLFSQFMVVIVMPAFFSDTRVSSWMLLKSFLPRRISLKPAPGPPVLAPEPDA